jgi:glycosyltransferase involved in cell wall biosynthesis
MTTAKQLKVVHVILSLDGGGLERVVIDLAREAGGVNQTPFILCIEKPGVLAPKAEAVAKLYCAEKGPGLRWSAVGKLRSVLREIRPDVVHTHQITALLYLRPIARDLMPTLVHTEHNNQFRRYTTVREKVTYFSMLTIAGPRVDRMFGVSDDATESIRRVHVIPGRKLVTVPNGINFDRFQQRLGKDAELLQKLGIPANSLVLGNIGRLTEMKRPDILVNAFARLSGEFPTAHLLLVGDGPMMAELKSQAAALKLSGRAHFTGFQSNPEPYLRLLDVFVLTSRMEGMPLAVLEAAASGIPVIASRVGGLAEMSNNGKSLLLYEFNDIEALSKGLRRLMTDDSFRQSLAGSGREHVLATYSAARMARDYDDHYRQLIG